MDADLQIINSQVSRYTVSLDGTDYIQLEICRRNGNLRKIILCKNTTRGGYQEVTFRPEHLEALGAVLAGLDGLE